MSLCAGFVRSRDRAQGWKPCARARLSGDKLCREHRDALDGAVFGLFQSLEPSDESKRSAQRRNDRNDWRRSAKRPSGKERDKEKKLDQKHPAETSNSLPVRIFKPIKRRRRRRIRLGEAFRKVGLDEQTVAETYVSVVERLRDKTEIKVETAQKLLVDVLKECSRILEPPRGSGGASPETPAIVELHHDVARPERDMPETDANGF